MPSKLPKLMSIEDLEDEAHEQLEHSGITFSVQHIGNVSLRKSLNALNAQEQGAIGEICIHKLVGNLVDPNAKDESKWRKKMDKYAEFFNEDEEPEVLNTFIELIISSSVFLLVEDGALKKRIPIQDISVASPGTKLFDKHFCLVGHIQSTTPDLPSSRQCLVFMVDAEMDKVFETIKRAFHILAHTQTMKAVVAAKVAMKKIKLEGTNKEEKVPEVYLTPDTYLSPGSVSGSGQKQGPDIFLSSKQGLRQRPDMLLSPLSGSKQSPTNYSRPQMMAPPVPSCPTPNFATSPPLPPRRSPIAK